MNNNGSHSDMTVDTFKASAEALRGYWAECVRIGQETAELSPDAAFDGLRRAGLEAERSMFAATGGVNTHKGAIYVLGTVCGAVGRLWTPESPCRDADAILNQCAALTGNAVRADFTAAAEKPEDQLTSGERLYVRYGITGIRGETAAGLPSVGQTALPMFLRLVDQGLDRNRAGSLTLLSLIALGRDTNMISRGGIDRAKNASEQAKYLINRKNLPSEDEILQLDKDFISQNLSPGGCADLLAVTYLLSNIRRTNYD